MKKTLLIVGALALLPAIFSIAALSQPAPAPQLGIFRLFDAVNAANCTFAAQRNCGQDVNQVGQAAVDTTGKRITFRATATGLVPVASATDVAYLSGSATKTVRVNRITVSGTAGTNVGVPVSIIKRSTANSGGTCAALTGVVADSADIAATAVATSCTANPTLGSTVGTVAAQSLWLPTTAGAASPIADFSFGDAGGKPIFLRGTSQVLSVNLGGVSVTSGLLYVTFEFTEE